MPLEELMVLDQFLAGVPEDLRVWLKERKPCSVTLTGHGTDRRLCPGSGQREVSKPQVTGGRATRSKLPGWPNRYE